MKHKVNDFHLNCHEGKIAVRDYGGHGENIILVHGAGQNLEVWQLLAEILNKKYKIWAFDLRGHGQTTVKSKNCLQYWQDIDTIIKGLKLDPKLLIGHSLGGYAVSAYIAWKNQNIPILLLDGFVLDKFEKRPEGINTRFDRELLWNLFKYGLETNKNEMEEFIENEAINISINNPNFGISHELIKTFTRRSFFEINGKWIKKPTLDEMEIIAEPNGNEAILPDVNIYKNLQSSIGFVVGTKGFYMNRKSEIIEIINQNKNRFYYEIDCGHNFIMTKPNETKDIVYDFLDKIKN